MKLILVTTAKKIQIVNCVMEVVSGRKRISISCIGRPIGPKYQLFFIGWVGAILNRGKSEQGGAKLIKLKFLIN